MGELLRGFAASREQKFDSREDAKARRGLVCAIQSVSRHAELGSASISPNKPKSREAKWTLKQVQGDAFGFGG
ncbi:hypothetical protein [Sphingorhabdus sp.]|jgi:hypothetical protein|uniref:hypothetical protein n=1 Tax=Sphingorhabdus sp. TaxID=1902408 RepID=UPI003C716460|nr:hypothetical protein [Sphingomonadales bacterium]